MGYEGREKKPTFVNHVTSICHTDDQNIVQLFHTVNLGQQLIDDRVMNAGIAWGWATTLTDGIDFVEDDNM